ncbi:MAG: class C sortase [Peptoniphilus sp.]|nr:class C sortase [Peptoniphilus sp.]MDY6044746.1 class C sortase [Peptoniphilus sp.]
MKNNNNERGTLFIVLGVALILGGLFLSYKLEEKNNRQKSEALKLEEALGGSDVSDPEIGVEKNRENDPEGQGSRQEPESSRPEEGSETSDQSDVGPDRGRELPGDIGVGRGERDYVGRSEAIGVIRIDKIGALLRIFDNTSKEALLDGVGVVETTDFPSSEKNTISVLAGHRGSARGLRYFLDIGKLETGDEIKVTTRDEILYYRIVGDEVVEPTDWSKFTREEDKTKLFLMACHPYPKNDKRLLVKSELVESVKK